MPIRWQSSTLLGSSLGSRSARGTARRSILGPHARPRRIAVDLLLEEPAQGHADGRLRERLAQVHVVKFIDIKYLRVRDLRHRRVREIIESVFVLLRLRDRTAEIGPDRDIGEA